MTASPDMARILALPRRDWDDIGEISPLLRSWSDRLWPAQLATLARKEQAPEPQGILGDLSVGAGKFLVGYLAPRLLNCKNAVVLTYPDLLKQSEREMAVFRKIFPEVVGYEPTYVSYSMLSSQKRVHLLDELAPGVIIADEGHALCGRYAARTLRLMKYMITNPQTRFSVLSGTLARPLAEIAHLAEMALRDDTFLPLRAPTLKRWAQALDHGNEPSKEDLEILRDLQDWAGVDDHRKAFQLRYKTTPGVIRSPEADVRASLVLNKWSPRMPPKIKEAVDNLAEEWVLPDGTELVDAMAVHAHGGTLSCGFYYSAVGNPEDHEDWYEARRDWGRALRLQIHYVGGYDSPANVWKACEEGKAHPEVQASWRRWLAIRDDYKPESVPVWIDKSLVQAAVARLKSKPKGLLWYSSKRAMEPVLAELGLPVHGAGSDVPDDSVKHATLSINTHGTGKNLQAWDDQVVFEPPSGYRAYEQLLGRTHRPGQLSDCVKADILFSSAFHKARLYSALSKCRTAQENFDKNPKLLICSWGH